MNDGFKFESAKTTPITVKVARYIDQKDNGKCISNSIQYDRGVISSIREVECLGFSRLYNNTRGIDAMRGRWRSMETGRVQFQIKSYPCAVATPKGIVEEATNIYEKDKFWVLCSGGKDSISLVDYIERNYADKFEGVLHIDTTMGIEAGRVWLKEYCADKGWKLRIEKPEQDIFTWLIKTKGFGFPDVWLHSLVMRMAKLEPMKNFVGRLNDPNVGLISGVRAMESIRRMGNYNTPIDTDEQLFFVKPFFYKTTEEVYKYLFTNGLKKSPISDVLGYSGECNDGCFMQQNELEKISFLDKNLYKRIIGWHDWIDVHGLKKGYERFNRYGGNNKFGKERHAQVIKDLGLDEEFVEKTEAITRLICGEECGASTMRGAGFV